jgi:hypothetical protein
MTIEKGFKIEKPDIFIPWDINENELDQLFKSKTLRHVATGYYTTAIESLGGLKCELGFHFEPRNNGLLKEFEFFRTDYSDQEKSFKEFQLYFEQEFGKPTSESMGNDGFKNYAWNFNGAQIVHFVFDRFGPEEHMRIKRTVEKRHSTQQ